MGKAALAPSDLPIIDILLVEDDPSDADLIGGMLGTHDASYYNIHHVKTQSEAIEALSEHMFSVCILDLVLPDANGFSALIDIQQRAPDMPVLILTGTNDMALAKQAVARGAQDYLLKDELAISLLGRSIEYAIERKQMENALIDRANHDALTGLTNRYMFENRLEMSLVRTERTGAGIAILFVDLDRFKCINDTYGHDAGDEVLRAVARRLKKILRVYDTPARFGGDEFAVLLEGITSPRDAAAIAQKFLDAINIPIPYHGKNFEVGASIGIMYSDDPISSEECLHRADTAMYHAKKEGGNTYRFFAPDMQDAAEARLKLEKEFRNAIAAGQLRLHYQPFMITGSDHILGVETLLRWAHPERGILVPEDFLSTAENERLMPEASLWIAMQLRRDIALWRQRKLPPLKITLNLSTSQLDDPGLLDWISPIAQTEFLGDHRLVVEIPEHVLISLSESRHMILKRMSDMGIGLHLDHFGRGALSLQTLLSLPFTMLKLDLSLIQGMVDDMEGDVLIGAAILLAHQIRMKVCAVGVEIPWQLDLLKKRRCDAIQGYFTAHPMPAAELVQWLAKRSAA